MKKSRRVIIVTDGDEAAVEVLEWIAQKIGGRCISASGGNPTPLDGHKLVELILSTPYDPVLIMFDDNGNPYMGEGEKAMQIVVNHPQIEVLGALAVASNTYGSIGASVDYSIDKYGEITEFQVNKAGDRIPGSNHKIEGDTVDVLRSLQIPIIIGIGDIGKMDGHDTIKRGCPITLKAIEMILQQKKFPS